MRLLCQSQEDEYFEFEGPVLSLEILVWEKKLMAFFFSWQMDMAQLSQRPEVCIYVA